MKTQLTIFVLLTALLGIVEFSTGQKQLNPFELTPRLDSMQLNELNYISETNPTENTDSSLLSDNPTGTDLSEESMKDLNDPKFNPFEVDHVPLRKSKLAELEQKIDFSTALVSSTAKSNNFLIWFLLISGALLAIAINTKPQFLTLLFRSLLNENMLKLLHREESQKISVHTILLYIIFGINLGTFIYLVIYRFGTANGVKGWLIIFVGVLGVYGIKHLALRIFGDLFNVEKSTSLYSFTVMLINLSLGLILIPANLFIAFAPDKIADFIFHFTIGVLVVLVVLRTIRGFFIASEFLSNRLFQLFIYLCAFEIAPVLILVKTALKIVY